MKLAVLVDNNIKSPEIFGCEHGLSIYFEIDNMKYLLDVGASDLFSINAMKMGIDISDIDVLILSHAHYDHTGGLKAFLSLNKKARIYLSSNINGNKYYSTRRGFKRDISIDYSIIKENKERFVFISNNTSLSPSVTLFGNIPSAYPLPRANRTLLVDDSNDNFNHEIAVSIKKGNESVILSSCSHRGVLNTLQASNEKNIIAYIGGFHLIDSDISNQFETNDEIVEMANIIKNNYPSIKLITGHCTGNDAKSICSDIFKENFIIFYSGFCCNI